MQGPQALGPHPKSGAWLTILFSRWHGSLMTCNEWRNSIRLRYGTQPLGLYKY